MNPALPLTLLWAALILRAAWQVLHPKGKTK